MGGETSKLGCGLTSYPSGRFVATLVVCNYGKAGNSIGQQVYQTGAACSSCPRGSFCSQQNPSLCTARSSGEVLLGTAAPSTSSPQAPPSPSQPIPIFGGFRPMGQNTNFPIFLGNQRPSPADIPQ